MDAAVAQMRAFGASDHDVAAFRERTATAARAQTIELLRANAVTAAAFFAVSTSWVQVMSPTGRLIRTGMRWADVAARVERLAAYRALDDRGRDRLWDDLAVMERAALAEMALTHGK